MEVAVTLGLAALLLGALAVLFSWILGYANRAFFVEEDPKIAKIVEVLPGANCGGCGFAGCHDYAEALASGATDDCERCGVCRSADKQKIGEIIGKKVERSVPQRAVVFCHATSADRLMKYDYKGELTCHAANLLSGVQGCTFGCLGFGDCVRTCPQGAIQIRDGVAVVSVACIGCRACANQCPRNVIRMVPVKAQRMLLNLCTNADFGRDVTRACAVGCIGCSLCTKAGSLIEMKDNLAVVRLNVYDPTADYSAYIKRCKRGTLRLVDLLPQGAALSFAPPPFPPEEKTDA